MKLSDYKNEEAIEVLADLIEPATEILTDKKVQKVFQGKKINKVEMAKYLLKAHSKAIVQVMAALNRVPYEKYEFNMLTGLKQVLELLSDEELLNFFYSQGQMMTAESSSSVTENTEATEGI